MRFFSVEDTKKTILDLSIVCLGCIIQAFSITCILKPNNLVVGGITGVSLSFSKVIDINYTYIYYFICMGILILAKVVLGKGEIKRIIFLSLTYPLILICMNKISFNFMEGTEDKILICLYYGIFMGIGTGLVLKKGFSQGSSDTLAKILHKKIFYFMELSQVLLMLDIAILLLSGFVFGKTAILYAIIMQVVYSKTISVVSFGFGSSMVKVVIISGKLLEISDYILNTMQRSYSVGNIYGGQSGIKRDKVILVCSLKEAMFLKEHIKLIDDGAFINFVPTIGAWGKEDGLQKLVEK